MSHPTVPAGCWGILSRSSRRGELVTKRGCLAIGVWLSLCGWGVMAAPSFALPEGRMYEMVTPPYKAGYDVYGGAIEAVAPDGESAAFLSEGSFDGQPTAKAFNAYLSRRGVLGWSTAPLEPPSTLVPSEAEQMAVRDMSPTLDSVLAEGALGPNAGYTGSDSPEIVFLLHATSTPDVPEDWQVGGSLELLSKKYFTPNYETASPDFCHVVFTTTAGSEWLVSQAVGTFTNLYDLATAGCSGEQRLSLVGLNNSGKPIDPSCEEVLGGLANGAQGSTYNAVADGGREVFFTTSVEPHEGHGHCGRTETPVASNPAQVFVRLDATRTVEVSRPLGQCVGQQGGAPGEVPCKGASSRPPAVFWGASEDGSLVFFTTTAKLVSSDGDEGEDLYVARIGCAEVEPGCDVAHRQVISLSRVSDAVSGEASEVQGVVKMASDGSRVYFVARGVLGEAPGAEGALPVRGADNLYVSDTATGSVTFIGDLCSGPEGSGSVKDARCPVDLEAGKERSDGRLWTAESQYAQVAGPAGDPARFLLFGTFARLIAHGAEADVDDARDIYRYDTLMGALDRVSLGEGAHDANGNCDDGPGGSSCDAKLTPVHLNTESLRAQDGDETRAISDGGSRIVFESAEPLSSSASNGLANVYEWEEAPVGGGGGVSMVSTGSSPEPEEDAVMSATGADIFFVTSQGLLAQDTDGQADVYDARLDGGFAPEPPREEPCVGDTCRGALTNPAPLLVPGSVPQAAGGNFVAPRPAKAKAKARSKRSKTVRKAKGKARKKGRGRSSRAPIAPRGRTGR